MSFIDDMRQKSEGRESAITEAFVAKASEDIVEHLKYLLEGEIGKRSINSSAEFLLRRYFYSARFEAEFRLSEDYRVSAPHSNWATVIVYVRTFDDAAPILERALESEGEFSSFHIDVEDAGLARRGNCLTLVRRQVRRHRGHLGQDKVLVTIYGSLDCDKSGRVL